MNKTAKYTNYNPHTILPHIVVHGILKSSSFNLDLGLQYEDIAIVDIKMSLHGLVLKIKQNKCFTKCK